MRATNHQYDLINPASERSGCAAMTPQKISNFRNRKDPLSKKTLLLFINLVQFNNVCMKTKGGQAANSRLVVIQTALPTIRSSSEVP